MSSWWILIVALVTLSLPINALETLRENDPSSDFQAVITAWPKPGNEEKTALTKETSLPFVVCLPDTTRIDEHTSKRICTVVVGSDTRFYKVTEFIDIVKEPLAEATEDDGDDEQDEQSETNSDDNNKCTDDSCESFSHPSDDAEYEEKTYYEIILDNIPDEMISQMLDVAIFSLNISRRILQNITRIIVSINEWENQRNVPTDNDFNVSLEVMKKFNAEKNRETSSSTWYFDLDYKKMGREKYVIVFGSMGGAVAFVFLQLSLFFAKMRCSDSREQRITEV